MSRTPVFYSFHFDEDVFRVQQIRNMGVLDGNEPVKPNDWETVKRAGEASVKRWIDEELKYKRCLVVLVGAQTAFRPWVKYEIEKAWNDGKGVFGIHIHGFRCPRRGIGMAGPNPFTFLRHSDGRPLSSSVSCYDPGFVEPYRHVSTMLQRWVDSAIDQRRYL